MTITDLLIVGMIQNGVCLRVSKVAFSTIGRYIDIGTNRQPFVEPIVSVLFVRSCCSSFVGYSSLLGCWSCCVPLSDWTRGMFVRASTGTFIVGIAGNTFCCSCSTTPVLRLYFNRNSQDHEPKQRSLPLFFSIGVFSFFSPSFSSLLSAAFRTDHRGHLLA